MRFQRCLATLAICLAGQVAFARLAVTEVASTSGAPAGVLEGLDWWELTNTGPSSVLLDGYTWEDNPIENARGIFPNGVTVAAGESIIIHQGTLAGIPAAFRSAWGLSNSVQVLDESVFTGTNPFSGLSSGGDRVHLFDASNTLVSRVIFGASTSGRTFEWNTEGVSPDGVSLGLSTAGENGAYFAAYGAQGSPGIAVPEPTTIALVALSAWGLVCGGRRRRK